MSQLRNMVVAVMSSAMASCASPPTVENSRVHRGDQLVKLKIAPGSERLPDGQVVPKAVFRELAAAEGMDELQLSIKGYSREQVQELKNRAESGEVASMMELAGLYYSRWSMTYPRNGNPQAAVRWLTPAAERGDLRALEQLGSMYLWGIGAQENISEGKRLLDRARAIGSMSAELDLNEFRGLRETPIGPPIRVDDHGTGRSFTLESDRRHVVAQDSEGKVLWRTDPFVEGGLTPYRTVWPVIVHFAPGEDDSSGRSRVITVSFNSSQFGVIDKETGHFEFSEQD